MVPDTAAPDMSMEVQDVLPNTSAPDMSAEVQDVIPGPSSEESATPRPIPSLSGMYSFYYGLF